MINRNTIAALILFASSLCVSQIEAAPKVEQWVGTWGASPVAALPNVQSFNNQTLRLIVHPSLPGDQVRIRIGNTFGTRSLVIGNVNFALQATDAAVIAESRRAVTFGGRTSISIPPGAIFVSDPVRLAVTAQKNLAVSIYLPQDAGPVAAHPGATQVSYVSTAGDFVAHADADVFTTQIQSWPLLRGIEVLASSDARTVVTFGDSITDGYKSTVNANRRWPDFLAARLLAAKQRVGIVNQGISGNRLLNDALGGQPRFGPNALSRFDRDVLSVSGASHVVILIGINDIGMGSAARNPAEAVSADDIIAGYRQLIVRARAKKLKVIGATLTPFGGAGYYTDEGEQKRQAVNKWVRTAKEFDGVIDFDAAVRDPQQPNRLLPAYDSGDHLHPSDAGYETMGKSIDLSLFK